MGQHQPAGRETVKHHLTYCSSDTSLTKWGGTGRGWAEVLLDIVLPNEAPEGYGKGIACNNGWRLGLASHLDPQGVKEDAAGGKGRLLQ